MSSIHIPCIDCGGIKGFHHSGCVIAEKIYTKKDVDLILNDVLNGLMTGKYKHDKHSNGVAQFVMEYLENIKKSIGF